MFLSGKFHDTIIKVKGQEIRTHKNILSLRSPIFEDMLRKNNTGCDMCVITDEGSNPEVFKEFLSFLYSGKLENVSVDNVIEFYNIADEYQVNEVKYKCVEFMMSNMSDKHFCDFIAFAVEHGEIHLLNSATDFFIKHSENIIETAKWWSFHKKYRTVASKLYRKTLMYFTEVSRSKRNNH